MNEKLKIIHLLCACLFLGNVIVSGVWAVLAGVLTGCTVILPLFVDAMPRNTFAVLAMVANAGAIWARLLTQPKDGL